MKRISVIGVLAVTFNLSGYFLAFAQNSADGSATSSFEDGLVTVYTARKIVTMDPGWPEATAVAVKDRKILSVGTLNDLKPWLDKYPHKIDKQFQGRVIYPGFVEAHSHRQRNLADAPTVELLSDAQPVWASLSRCEDAAGSSCETG